MQHSHKKIAALLFAFFIVSSFTNSVLAVSNVCPGEPITLYWTSADVAGVCVPYYSIPECTFSVSQNTTQSTVITTSNSCDVSLTCDDVVVNDSIIINPNQSRCCGNWALTSSTYWSGSTCSEGSDLTATVITPTSAIVGDTTILSSTVTNSGPFSTNSSFSNLFQVTFAPNGTGGVIDVSPLSVAGPLSSGASTVITRTTTFSGGPRTYSYRLCADKTSSAGGSVINEIDENNNCGAWQNITVTCPVGKNWVAGSCVAGSLSNLTTDAATPATSIAGVSTLFSARVRNVGAGNVTAPFSNLFQISDQPGGAGSITDLYPLVGFGFLSSGLSTFANFSYSFPDGPATYSIRSCADQTSNTGGGVVWEDDETDNCGAWTDVVVTCPVGTYWSTDSCVVGVPDVDLEADASTPVSAVPNISNTLSAVIRNTGTTPTGNSFNIFFQIASQPSGGGSVTDLPSVSTLALGSGASRTIDKVYTFSDGPGTNSVRICTDKTSSADSGVITESDETNNCGTWTDVTVACTGSDQWDTIGQTCTDPDVISAVILNQYYPPGAIRLECNADTTSYSITTNFPAPGTVVVAPGTPYTYPSTIALNTPAPYGTSYSMTCAHGSVSASRSVAYDPTPRPTTMVVNPGITVVTDPPTDVPVTWVIAYPDNTCTLSAKVVCANNACSAAQLANETALNNQLGGAATTDASDPNTSRLMTTALRNPAPGHKDSDTPVIIADYKALGKKTLQITNTTDLTLDCNGSKITKRIRVTKNEEQ